MFLFQQLTKDTQMHCRRVSELAVKLAVLCGEPVVNQTKISVAAIYHDIGKIKLPEEILTKTSHTPNGLRTLKIQYFS